MKGEADKCQELIKKLSLGPAFAEDLPGPGAEKLWGVQR